MALKKPNPQEPKKEDPRRIKVCFDYGYPGIPEDVSYYELPEGWDDWTEEERKNHLDMEAETVLQNSYIEYGAYLVEKEGD